MNREAVKQTMLLAMSDHHSGNAQEALRIVDAQLSALEAAGLRLVPVHLSEKVIAELVPRPAHWPPEGEAPRMDAAVMTDRTVVVHMYRRLLAASPYAPEGG